jgi:PAS domain S-box-containing protein
MEALTLSRIIFVEDVPEDQELAERTLRKEGFQFTSFRVDEKEGFLKALSEFRPDLVISDFALPAFDGMQALALSLAFDPNIPVIILTGSMNEDTAVACLKAGASDYVIKEHIARLPLAVKGALEQKSIRRSRLDSERALHETNQMLQAMILASPLAIDVLDTAGRVTLWSPAAERMFGWSAAEVIGRELPIIPENLRDEVAQQIRERMRGVAITMLETQRQHKDGSLVEVSISTAPIYNPQGKITGIMAIMADIGPRKQAEETLRQRLSEARALYNASSVLRSANTVDESLPALLSQILSAMGIEAGGIWLVQAPKTQLRLATAFGWFRQFDQYTIKPRQGIIGWVFATGQIYQSPDIASDSLPIFIRTGISVPQGEGGICIPIRTAEEITGVLMISYPAKLQIPPDQIKLLTSLTEIVGATLYRIRLHEEILRHLNQVEALHQIDLEISFSLDLSHTLDVLLEKTLSQLKVDAASVLLFRPDTGTLDFAAGLGFRTFLIEQTSILLGEGCAGRVALSKQPLLITSFGKDCDFERNNLLSEESFQAYFGIPLISKGAVTGVLEIFQRSPLHPVAEWMNFAETLAGQAAIAIDNSQLYENLQIAHQELSAAYDDTIEGWSHAIDLRDKETEKHSQRVTDLTLKLAAAFGMKDEQLVYIRRGCLLHDIGKLGVPDFILFKPGALSVDEWVSMRRHPEYALDMLFPISYLRPAIEIPYCHHEKWDGTGYPRGLKGEQIPLEARIFAVVDVWDALTSERPYRPAAWPQAKALDYIREQSGKHFDPQVVELFLHEIKNSLE